MVVLVDGESMTKKLPWDDVKQNAPVFRTFKNNLLEPLILLS
jgi:hypothetical protein